MSYSIRACVRQVDALTDGSGGIGGRDDFEVAFTDKCLYGGIEETDGLAELVGEEGVGGGGFDDGGYMYRGGKVDLAEIDECLFCGFGIARGVDPRNPSLLSLSSRSQSWLRSLGSLTSLASPGW